MNYEIVTIGEICEFVRGVTFDGNEVLSEKVDGYIPILRAGNISDTLEIQNDLVWVPSKRVSKEQYLRNNDIAICMASGSSAMLGKTAQVTQNFIGSIGAFCGIIRVKKADPSFIGYYFKSSEFMKWRDRQARGINIQNLRPTEIQEIQINLPPLPEQQRIAAILQKADRLRHLRRYARQLSDGYLQSVFLEMFGDPATNPKGWKKSTIEDISLLVTDGEHITPNRISSGIKLLSARNIQNGYIDFEAEIDYVSIEEYKRIKKRCNPEFEDILISCSGSVGRITTVRTHEPFTLIRSVALIKVDKSQIWPYYLEHFLRTRYSQDMIRKYAKTSSQANLFQGPIKELPVLLPPINLQASFTEYVTIIDNIFTKFTESERQAEQLYQTLLQRAFQGEL